LENRSQINLLLVALLDALRRQDTPESAVSIFHTIAPLLRDFAQRLQAHKAA